VEKTHTAKEVARRLGVTSRTIQNWIAQGWFPNAYKLNPKGLTSRYCIPEGDIEAFEAERTKQHHSSGVVEK